MIDRLRARDEWKFFGVLRQADRALAVAWWTLLVLRGVLPALFAIAMGGLVGAVQQAGSLAAPLGLVGIVFVLLQVLSPMHQAIGANLGSRTAAWLYDRLTTACVRPPGMGHLENPKLTTDLTMARDFDLGISGPPMSISMDFIACGLVEMVGGPRLGGRARRLTPGGRRWCSPAPGSPRTGCCAKARCGATAIPRKSARRSATPTTPTASRSIRRPPRNSGSSGWPAGPSSVSERSDAVCSICAGRPPACGSGPCSGACCWCSPRTSWCSGRWAPRRPRAVSTLGRLVTFASAAVSTSMIAFGGLSWALDGAAAPAAAVLRLQEAMEPAGALVQGTVGRRACRRARSAFATSRFAYPATGEPVLDGFDLTIPAGSSLAIVGQNGAGKTTLAKLLCRLYDPQDGAIEVDGVDLRELDLDGWRSRVAAVFQDFIRFELPLRDNVAPAGAPDDVIQQALAEAGAARLAGLDTPTRARLRGRHRSVRRPVAAHRAGAGPVRRAARRRRGAAR